MLKNLLFTLIGCVFLCSCNDKEKLSGKRQPIFESKVEWADSTEPIRLGSITNIKSITENTHNKENLFPLASLALTNGLRPVWKSPISASSELINSGDILLMHDMLYFTDSYGYVICARASDGTVMWRFASNPKNKTDTSSTYISGAADTLAITNSFADLMVIDSRSGHILRKRSFNSPAKSEPRYYSGKLFVMETENVLNSISFTSLRTLWQNRAAPEENGLLGLSPVAIFDNSVIVPYKNGDLVSLNIDSGEENWRHTLFSPSVTESIAAMAHIKAAPVIYGARVYAISNCGRVVCLKARDGSLVWKTDVAGGVFTPIIAGNALYFLSNDNSIIALNNRTGERFWTAHLPELKKKDTVWHNALLTSAGMIVANSAGDLVFLDPLTGKTRRTIKTGMEICATPKVANGILYILARDGLHAFH